MSTEGPLRPRAPRSGGLRRIDRVMLDLIDLRAIEYEMRTIGPVEVVSDQFAGSTASVDELVEHGVTSLQRLDISASREGPSGFPRSPSLSVSITRERVYIHPRSDDRVAAGVQASVEQICRAGRRRLARLNAAVSFATAALGVLLIVTASSLTPDVGPVPAVAGWLTWIGLALSGIALFMAVAYRFAKGAILLVPRHEQPGWLTRNRDGLALQVIVGLVVFFVGLVIGRLT